MTFLSMFYKICPGDNFVVLHLTPMIKVFKTSFIKIFNLSVASKEISRMRVCRSQKTTVNPTVT